MDIWLKNKNTKKNFKKISSFINNYENINYAHLSY